MSATAGDRLDATAGDRLDATAGDRLDATAGDGGARVHPWTLADDQSVLDGALDALTRRADADEEGAAQQVWRRAGAPASGPVPVPWPVPWPVPLPRSGSGSGSGSAPRSLPGRVVRRSAVQDGSVVQHGSEEDA